MVEHSVRAPLRVHGLEFRFEPADGGVDDGSVSVVVDPPSPVRDEPPDDVAMRCDHDGVTMLYALRSPEQWTLVYPGLMEIDVSADTRTARFRLHPDTEEQYVELMLVGTVSALVMTLRGEIALHASAVEHDGGVIAFAGPSGQGKSTTATLVALGGAPVFTDDTLRLTMASDPIIAHQGAVESRLRDSASQLADLAGPGIEARHTADGRTGLSLPVSGLATAPLRAIVLPRPHATAERPSIEVMEGLTGFKELHACLRLVGWRDREMLTRGFHDIGALLDRVPVLRAQIPWGAPYRVEQGVELMECVVGYLSRSSDE